MTPNPLYISVSATFHKLDSETASGVTVGDDLSLVRIWGETDTWELRQGETVLETFTASGNSVKLLIPDLTGETVNVECYVGGVLVHTEEAVAYELPDRLYLGVTADGDEPTSGGAFDSVTVSPCPINCTTHAKCLGSIFGGGAPIDVDLPLFWDCNIEITGSFPVSGVQVEDGTPLGEFDNPLPPENPDSELFRPFSCEVPCSDFGGEWTLLNDGYIAITPDWSPVGGCTYTSAYKGPSQVLIRADQYLDSLASPIINYTRAFGIIPPDTATLHTFADFEANQPHVINGNAYDFPNSCEIPRTFSYTFFNPVDVGAPTYLHVGSIWRLEVNGVGNEDGDIQIDMYTADGNTLAPQGVAWYRATVPKTFDFLNDPLVVTKYEPLSSGDYGDYGNGCTYPSSITLNLFGTASSGNSFFTKLLAKCETTCQTKLNHRGTHVIQGEFGLFDASFCTELTAKFNNDTFSWEWTGSAILEDTPCGPIVVDFAIECKALHSDQNANWWLVISHNGTETNLPLEVIDEDTFSTTASGTVDVCGLGAFVASTQTITEDDATGTLCDPRTLVERYCDPSCPPPLDFQKLYTLTAHYGDGESCSFAEAVCDPATNNWTWDWLIDFHFPGSPPCPNTTLQVYLSCYEKTPGEGRQWWLKITGAEGEWLVPWVMDSQGQGANVTICGESVSLAMTIQETSDPAEWPFRGLLLRQRCVGVLGDLWRSRQSGRIYKGMGNRKDAG